MEPQQFEPEPDDGADFVTFGGAYHRFVSTFRPKQPEPPPTEKKATDNEKDQGDK